MAAVKMLDAARSNQIGDDFIVIGTTDVRFPSGHRPERGGSSTGCGRGSLPKQRFESDRPVDGCGIHPFGGGASTSQSRPSRVKPGRSA